jgi:branched-subunit amino acid aminotransferase/4-amino-4-deoxychorismate lyase
MTNAHQQRLHESLQIVGIDSGRPLTEVFDAAAELAARNHAVGPADDDLGLVIFVTPGDQPSQHRGMGGTPRTVIHTFPLAFRLWADAYACWPVQAKVRSRLHYFLADREAHAAEPGAKAVVCHLDGRVSETSTANIAIVRDGTILAPPAADALAGVSLRCAESLAESLGLSWTTRSLTEQDLADADEILLTSTPNCILPATRFNGRAIGTGRPGRIYQSLLAAWSGLAGLDIAAQAHARAASTGGSV